MNKKIQFFAVEVECSQAIDFELQQVCFDAEPPCMDEEEEEDVMNRVHPYFLMSGDFEHSGPDAVEWHDGRDYGGGDFIKSFELSRNRFAAELMNGLIFDVIFEISDEAFFELREYVNRIAVKGRR